MIRLQFDLFIQFRDFELKCAFDNNIGMLAITGRSGIGKTSLLNAIAGLIMPEQGLIKIDNEILFDADHKINVPAFKRQIGYVFQDSRLFPHLSVHGNLSYAAYLARHRPALVDRTRLVELLGLENLLDRYPSSLSGGEQQRVAIARALMSSPRLLLLDEPLAAIDKVRRDLISTMLIQLHREFSIPMILVSHNANDVAQLSDMRLALEPNGQ